ncbi:MAG: leucine-rich repeat protein, partial [Clostridia bacterium]|nr:leucine-rich repeat protein [Clostridia bacterium]
LEAFSGCQSLKTIKLSSGLINIPTKAFQSCRNLESVVIPNSIMSIDGMAFAYCSNLKNIYYTGSQNDWNGIVLNETYNQYLLNADIHYDYGSVTGNCGENASWSFNEITKTLTISGSGEIDEKTRFEEYGWYSFKDSISFVEIIDSVANVPANAFSGCKNLKDVYLGKSVSSVGENSFADCSSLLVFTLHTDNIAIADSAFIGCNEKLTFICPSKSNLASAAPNNAKCITVSFDEENSVLKFNGELTVYNGPKYDFLSVFLNEYSYADYIYFEKIVFDGVDSGIILDFEGADSTASDLTLTNLYVNLAVVRGNSQENITSEEMLELLESGDYDAFKFVIQSDDMNGEKTFIQKVEDFFAEITENALRAISSVINFIVKLFKKK